MRGQVAILRIRLHHQVEVERRLTGARPPRDLSLAVVVVSAEKEIFMAGEKVIVRGGAHGFEAVARQGEVVCVADGVGGVGGAQGVVAWARRYADEARQVTGDVEGDVMGD